MAEVQKKPVKIVETVLRDAHQSLLATRMTTDQMLPIVDKMDKVGYYAVECWGGATFDACLRFLKEDPWERLRKLRAGFKNTKLQMLFRGQNILGYKHYADDVVDELIDRFGEPPESVYGLIDIALLRNRATQLGITEVKQQANALLLYKDKFDMERVKRLIQGMPNKVMLSAGSRPYISVALGGKAPLTVLEDVLKVLCGDEDAKAPKPATK